MTVHVNDVPIPEITGNEILMKITSTSLCHSDLMCLDGSLLAKSGPVTIGHEAVGIVDKVGVHVKGFQPGDRIGSLLFKGCCCKSCRTSRNLYGPLLNTWSETLTDPS
jgi:D-arabinose 1-dehydrogenase-like Zn-dependent alcohol dehydrogenase